MNLTQIPTRFNRLLDVNTVNDLVNEVNKPVNIVNTPDSSLIPVPWKVPSVHHLVRFLAREHGHELTASEGFWVWRGIPVTPGWVWDWIRYRLGEEFGPTAATLTTQVMDRLGCVGGNQ